MVWRDYILFLHSPIDRHLDCFHLWAIMNKCCYEHLGIFLNEKVFQFSVGIYLVMEIAGSYCNSLTFWRTTEFLPQWLYILHSHKSCMIFFHSNFSTSPPILVIVRPFVIAASVHAQWYFLNSWLYQAWSYLGMRWWKSSSYVNTKESILPKGDVEL